ncbi:hypothetical protein C1701_10335 [Actinoalloteichus sp. AHMU CJ021]|uniref:DUF2511 domain-containing protein n=1 Tax=Actinoalloteichus caeruleus DSM 43889 TaxID=1120930 RepID=A0ABT1JMA0_ACTCY|nr:hypothetical protein [Actinoalloteichus caeruleus]AUS78699.1 hypothetical protein C1701_10335 [Actinoalloteichus sp. AHMU CJ021]MCP2332846.1 Protein of unknown function (DUF2511) [Actinoalloteichus caeruleus DSM 43889]
MGTRAGAVLAVALAAVGCGGVVEREPDRTTGFRQVSREAFDADGLTWPLTVDTAEVGCEGGGAVVVVEGTAYGITGAAQAAGVPALPEDLWADDSGIGHGVKVTVSDLISVAGC